ncbi:glyoxalase [Dyadobacter sp. CY312]|uniref:glyoxalase n=1 Tax=Dyadobacter sp. CY312 TaxID=2907303 RepID=UPI001F3A0519|nr:glyoxalase [Dyadobacter sp. CY312]MCE7044080.1 glyoxalase [Dyadobacter sp. CY312]
MKHTAKSIRPFLGARNFELSRRFYQDLGFQENVLSEDLTVFKLGQLAFYLQGAYVKDWIDNTMIFLEVENVERYYQELSAMQLSSKYDGVKLSGVRIEDWGKECFLHDPSGILWHIGEFQTK